VADYARFAAAHLQPALERVTSASLTPALRGALDSPAGQASLIAIGWRQLDSSAIPGVSLTQLRAYMAAHPYPGVTARATGDVAINNDYMEQIHQSTEPASASESWALRVRAYHDQSLRAQQRASWSSEGADGPLPALFTTDSSRTDDPFLNRLRRAIDASTTVLDVGGGAGRYRLPLALQCRQVTVRIDR
jgi:hypothetical protein